MGTNETLPQRDRKVAADAATLGKLDLVLEYAGIGLGIVDRDLRFLHVNKQLADMNGVPMEGHLGRTVRDVLPELGDYLDSIFLPILATGIAVEGVDVHGETPAHPDVERHWKANYYPNRAADGTIVGLLFVVREVTEEDRLEGALKDTASRLHMAMEGSDLGVWDWSVDTGEVWFSDTWQTMLGYEPGEVPPHVSAWQNAIHPDDLPAINSALDPHFSNLTTLYEVEHRVRCKDGSWLWVLARGRVVKRAPDGQPLRMVGTHDNINSRKKDQLYRGALLELSRDLAELDSVNRIIDRSLLTILDTLDVDFAGYTENGEGGTSPRMIRRWRDGQMGTSHGNWVGVRIYKEIAQRLFKGEPVALTDIQAERLTHVADTGEQLDGQDLRALMVVPILRQDRLIGTMLAGNKMSQRWSARKLEFLSDVQSRTREAIARAKAGEANRQAKEEIQRIGRLNALSALTSTLAHELNQPLAAANNYLTVAKLQSRRFTPDNVAPEMTPEHIIDLAAQQVVRAGEIIRRMRTFTHSGEVTGRLTNLVQAVDSAIEATLSSMNPRALTIRKSYAESLPDIMLDSVQFQQVISNLVRNAIEAMEGIEKPELGITLRGENGNIIIDVTDNGPGFGPGVLETLFQPFRSQKPRGLGLGLPICRTIVEAHGGNITGETRKESGVMFRISLPVDA